MIFETIKPYGDLKISKEIVNYAVYLIKNFKSQMNKSYPGMDKLGYQQNK